MKITIVGCGHMGSIFAEAFFLNSAEDDLQLLLVEKREELLQGLKEKVAGVGCQIKDPLLKQSDIIVLAVKPQDFNSIAADLKTVLSPAALLVSVMAGITIKQMTTLLCHGAIIRAMPNAAVVNGYGMTAYYCGPEVTSLQSKLFECLFNTMGLVERVSDEDMLNAVTALSGSGPAYFFYLMQAMTKAGKKMGVSEDFAYKLLKQTMIGAYYLMENSDKSLQELINTIASKGGTTEAALDVLNDNLIDEYIKEALCAAKQRAKELSTGK